jgi:fructose-1,6-bisphosphatase
MSYSKVITLEQYIVDQQALYKDAQGSLSKIFRSLELAAKMVNRDVRKAGLIDILGNQGSTNIQGEEQKVGCDCERYIYCGIEQERRGLHDHFRGER